MDRRAFIKVSSSLAWGAEVLSPGNLFLRSPEAAADAATVALEKVPDFAGYMTSPGADG